MTSPSPVREGAVDPWLFVRRHVLLGTFVLMSIADYLLTWILVADWELATESNPLAELILGQTGWVGLLCFKACITLLPILLIARIARRNPHSAQRMSCLAVMTISIVVAYSSSLILESSGINPMVRSEEEHQRIAARGELLKGYRDRAQNEAQRIMEGKSTLRQSVRRLEAWSALSHYQSHSHLRVYVGEIAPEAVIATDVIRRAGRYSSTDEHEAACQLEGFQREFEDRYHLPLHRWAWEHYIRSGEFFVVRPEDVDQPPEVSPTSLTRSH